MHQTSRFEPLHQWPRALIFGSALVLVACSDCHGAGSSAPGPECNHPEFLLDGIRDARQRLQRGVYEATGHVVRRRGGDSSIEGELSIFSAFDYSTGVMRFDRMEPHLFADEKSGTKYVRQIGIKIARTQEKTLVWDRRGGLNTSHFLGIHPADYKLPPYGIPFDVRTFGLMGWSSVQEGTTFKKADGVLRGLRVLRTSPGKNGECIVVFRHGPNDDVESKLWVNPSRGFTATRLELRALNPRSKKWSDVMSLTEVKWTQISDVWVPASLLLERHFNGEEVYNLNIKWRSVNAKLPSRLFEPEGMQVDPETILVDRRLGSKPVVVRKIGDPNYIHPSQRGQDSASPNNRQRLLVWLLVGNAGLLILYVLWTIWRKLRV